MGGGCVNHVKRFPRCRPRCATAFQNWHEAINKTKLVYAELKLHGSATSWDDGYNVKYDLSGCEIIGPAGIGAGGGGGAIVGGVGMPRNKSPMNSSIGSRISSLNNSHR